MRDNPSQRSKTQANIFFLAPNRNFTEYVTLAEKSGVVKTGAADTPGREWIALAEAYKGKIFPVL